MKKNNPFNRILSISFFPQTVNFIRKFRLHKILNTFLLPIAVGAAILLLLRDRNKISFDIFQIKPTLVLFSFLISFVGLLIAILTWKYILRSYGLRFSIVDDIKIYIYSSIGAVLPGGIWTIVSRVNLYNGKGAPLLSITTAALIEKIIVGIAAMGIYSITSIIRPDISLIKSPLISIIFTIFLLSLLHPKVFKLITHWYQEYLKKETDLQQINYNSRSLAIWLFLEMLVVFIGGIAVFLLLKSVTDATLPLLIPVCAAWSAAAIAGNLFFWIPGTPLLRDGAMVIALSSQLPIQTAVAFVILVRIWNIFSILTLVAFIWLLFDRPRLRKG